MNKKILAKILAVVMVISSITLPEGVRQVNAAETTQYREMLTNGDFSTAGQGLSGWEGIDSTSTPLKAVEIGPYDTYVSSKASGVTSNNVLELNGTSGQYPETIYQSVPVLPGSQVTISFWYSQRTKDASKWGTQKMLLSVVPAKYNDGTEDVAASGLTRELFENNALPGTNSSLKLESGNASISGSIITAGDTWSHITGTYTVPSNVYEVYVGFHGVSSTAGGGNILAGASVKTALLNDVYVSSAGSDTTGGGTKDAPFATLGKAFSWVADDGTVHVMDDLTLTDAGVTFSESKTVTVLSDNDGDLSDDDAFSVNRGGAFAAPMLAVSSGALTLKNLTLDGKKKTYNSLAVSGKGTGIDVTGGTLTLEDGFVLQNSYNASYNYYSAGLRIEGSGAAAIMNNGAAIRNNKCGDGAGVMVRTGTFTMNGGTISGNCSTYGAGVYLSANGVTGADANTAMAYLNGGTITNNYASSSSITNSSSTASNSGGGGLMVYNNSTAVLNGVTITGNGADSKSTAAGVYLYGTSNSILTVAGNTVISGNKSGATFTDNNTVTGGTDSNVYLKNGQTITIGENHLGSGASIGIYTETVPSGSADVQIAAGANKSDQAHFVSDNVSSASVLYCSGSSDSPSTGHHSSHAANTLWLSTAAAASNVVIDLMGDATNTQQTDNEYIYQLGNAIVTGENGRTFEISVDCGYFTVNTGTLPEGAEFYSSLDVGGTVGTALSTSAQYTYLSLKTNGAAADALQRFLRSNVTFYAPGTTADTPKQTVTVVAENADIPDGTEAFQGHYYQFVTSSDIKWSDAYKAAKQSKYNGLTGYLITVTSKQEHEYIYKKFGKNGWMGASRAIATNGYDEDTYTYSGDKSGWDWYWVCGPEAGTSFGTQSTSGGFATKSSTYSNWKAGEPNGTNLPGTANEGFGQYGYGSGGLWNDLRDRGAGCGYIQGYYVEYGGYKTDSANLTVAPASDSKTVEGNTKTTETAVTPEVKSATRTADTITIPAGSSDTGRDYAVMDSKGDIVGWQKGTGKDGEALVFTGLDPEETYTILESGTLTDNEETSEKHEYTTEGAQVLLPVPSPEQVTAGNMTEGSDGKTTTSIVISPAVEGLTYQAVSVDEDGNKTVVGTAARSEEKITDAAGKEIGTITTVTISGLDPGKEYTIQVVKSSGDDGSETVTTDGPTIIAPVAPVDDEDITRKTEDSGTTDTITVSNTSMNQFYALVDENGNYIQKDGTLSTEKDEAGNEINVPYWVSPEEAGETLIWSGLDSCTIYRVLTANKDGSGNSPAADAIPAETVVLYSSQITGDYDSETKTASITINPTVSGVNYAVVDADGNLVTDSQKGTGGALTFVGLEPGTAYQVVVLENEKKAGESAGDQAIKSAVSVVTPVDDTERKVQECKNNLEAAAKDVQVTNDTTEDALLKTLKSLLDKLGYSDVDISLSGFTKTKATETAVGKISATVTLTLDGKTVTLPLDFTIDQLKADEEKSDSGVKVKDQSGLTGEQIVKLKGLDFLLAKGTRVKKKMRISWQKYSGTTKYEVYWSRCDGTKNYKKLTATKKLTTVQKKLNAKKCYKYFVAAYRMVDGKKVYAAKSPVIHVAMKNSKQTNVKKLKVSKTKISLARGKTYKLSVSAVAKNKKKKLMTHAAKFRYYTADKKVATVNKNGKIRAKGKGTCYIYVVANNGKYKKIKVKVK